MLHLRYLTGFWICFDFKISQSSEYTRVLNMSGFHKVPNKSFLTDVWQYSEYALGSKYAFLLSPSVVSTLSRSFRELLSVLGYASRLDLFLRFKKLLSLSASLSVQWSCPVTCDVRLVLFCCSDIHYSQVSEKIYSIVFVKKRISPWKQLSFVANCSFRNTISEFKFEITLSYSAPILLGGERFVYEKFMFIISFCFSKYFCVRVF